MMLRQDRRIGAAADDVSPHDPIPVVRMGGAT